MVVVAGVRSQQEQNQTLSNRYGKKQQAQETHTYCPSDRHSVGSRCPTVVQQCNSATVSNLTARLFDCAPLLSVAVLMPGLSDHTQSGLLTVRQPSLPLLRKRICESTTEVVPKSARTNKGKCSYVVDSAVRAFRVKWPLTQPR